MNYTNSTTSWKPTDTVIDVQNIGDDLTELTDLLARLLNKI